MAGLMIFPALGV